MPAIVIQTPYNKENARSLWFTDDSGQPLFGSRDYAFVVVDWRGFFASKDAAVEGQQPYGQDGYDVIEWVAAQDWCNGQVGTWGVSALCVQQYRTAVEHPPHLAAAVPIFCQMNTTYWQYYPGGVLRQEYYDFMKAYYGGGDIVKRHPYYDTVWRTVERGLSAADIAVPMLLVSGWWDLYDTGTLDDFRALRANSDSLVRQQHRLLVGPWCHFAAGGESVAGRPLDEQELKYYDADKLIQADSQAFFDRHLRGIASPADDWQPARWLVGGTRQPEDGTSWPPAGTVVRAFYPTGGGSLIEQVPLATILDFPYDPDNPSPSVGGSTLLPSLKHGPRLQDEVLARTDALGFVSNPLAQPLRLRGKVKMQLRVKTSGADSDFAVRLTDVDEDGGHLLIGEGIGRLKLRSGYDAPVGVQPGQPYDLIVTLTNELAYDLPAGHRLGIIVSSSNYPRFARNPNTGDDFYEDATAPQTVTNTLVLGGATRLLVQVLP